MLGINIILEIISNHNNRNRIECNKEKEMCVVVVFEVSEILYWNVKMEVYIYIYNVLSFVGWN
jgi:hypothetical protein